MSPLVASFVRTAAVPAAVSTVAVFGCGSLSEPWRARVQALILSIAFMAGGYLLIGRLGFPPTDSPEAIIWASLICAGFVFAFPRTAEAPYLIRALFTAGMGALVLWRLGTQLHDTLHMRNMIAFFCLALGVWSIVERNVKSVQMLSLIGLPLITATCLSFILLFGGSAVYSQLVSILCTILGGLMLIALLRPGRLALTAVAPLVSVFVVLIMAGGHFYLDINPWKMVIMCIPYIFIWTRSWYPFIPRKPIFEFLFLAAMALVPLAYLMYDSFSNAGPLY